MMNRTSMDKVEHDISKTGYKHKIITYDYEYWNTKRIKSKVIEWTENCRLLIIP